MDEEAALPRLGFIDLVLHDLAVEIRMFVGRRPDEGDDETFVIQSGVDGRGRVRLPDMSDPQDVERCVAEAQAYLSSCAPRPVPRCLVEGHDHALRFREEGDSGCWRCPTSDWSCLLGEYEERSWPQVGVSLAPLLVNRLGRRGLSGEWARISVSEDAGRPVAKIQVRHPTSQLADALAAAAAPLEVEVEEYDGPPGPFRLLPGTGPPSL